MKRSNGLTKQEGEVMDLLVSAWSKYLKLPKQHPCDVNDFTDGIHKCRHLLDVRVARREDSNVLWYVNED